MASRSIQVDMLNLDYVRRVVFAVYDLLQEIEDGDAALLPNAVVDAAIALRAEIDEGPEV